MWPAYSWMTAAAASWYAHPTARKSSGSSWPESCVEPTRAQKSTVSGRRSASGGTFEGPMISTTSSARSGPGLGTAASGVPQLSQNLLPAWTFAPQLEQTTPNSAPHSRQNRAPSRFSARHRGHSMRLASFWLVHRIGECAERSARRHDAQGAGRLHECPEPSAMTSGALMILATVTTIRGASRIFTCRTYAVHISPRCCRRASGHQLRGDHDVEEMTEPRL